MAYRHFPEAPFLKCWSDGANICVQELNGSVTKYPCNLGFATEEQLVPFQGIDAMWCLKHEGVLYVGRNDSTFSGFTLDEHLLVRYGVWSYPHRRTFTVVGQYEGYDALLDSFDDRTVYISGHKQAFLLHKPLNESADRRLIPYDVYRHAKGLTIRTEGGMLDVKRAGAWVSAPDLPWGCLPTRL